MCWICPPFSSSDSNEPVIPVLAAEQSWRNSSAYSTIYVPFCTRRQLDWSPSLLLSLQLTLNAALISPSKKRLVAIKLKKRFPTYESSGRAHNSQPYWISYSRNSRSWIPQTSRGMRENKYKSGARHYFTWGITLHQGCQFGFFFRPNLSNMSFENRLAWRKMANRHQIIFGLFCPFWNLSS